MGLIGPEQSLPIKFKSVHELLQFYQSVLKRISNSPYEREFIDKYVEYIQKSDKPEEEPFLIPEMRYKGLEHHHDHRLDFTIMNPHTYEYIGIEISPTSTHLKVKKLTEEDEKINKALQKQWEKEVGKRNDYFDKFGINILTFTDSHLEDIDQCFGKVAQKLSARPEEKVTLIEQLDRLKKVS